MTSTMPMAISHQPATKVRIASELERRDNQHPAADHVITPDERLPATSGDVVQGQCRRQQSHPTESQLTPIHTAKKKIES